MATKIALKTKKTIIRLYEQDLEDAKKFFPETGYNAIVRETFHRFMEAKRRKIRAASDAAAEGEGNEQ
jgi:hypothetical protein